MFEILLIKDTLSQHARFHINQIADQKIAAFFYTTKHAFNAAESASYFEMIDAVTKAGPGYTPPGCSSS